MAYISQEDKKELAPAIKKVLKDFGMKGSISIRNHMSLVVTVTEGVLDFTDYFQKGDEGYVQVNHYHIDNFYSGTVKKFLKELYKAMKGTKWFDKSDAMVDYFHTAYYMDINIGKWCKPYVKVGA
tara:strand:- start:133 stop:507 length:375 start_codon:yes stop_codon:yes gene_type:complete